MFRCAHESVFPGAGYLFSAFLQWIEQGKLTLPDGPISCCHCSQAQVQGQQWAICHGSVLTPSLTTAHCCGPCFCRAQKPSGVPCSLSCSLAVLSNRSPFALLFLQCPLLECHCAAHFQPPWSQSSHLHSCSQGILYLALSSLSLSRVAGLYLSYSSWLVSKTTSSREPPHQKWAFPGHFF